MTRASNSARRPPPLVVVMGVSGAGKSTVGGHLARRLALPYVDGDALHSAENIAKMARGVPLDDADRAPWLASVGDALRAHESTGAVVSCSALRRAYRAQLSRAAPRALYLHLVGSADLLAQRVAQRTRHFMPAALLASQLAALEPLEPDEHGVALDASAPPEQIVDTFVRRIESLG